jgi:hypothetical protein
MDIAPFLRDNDRHRVTCLSDAKCRPVAKAHLPVGEPIEDATGGEWEHAGRCHQFPVREHRRTVVQWRIGIEDLEK